MKACVRNLAAVAALALCASSCGQEGVGALSRGAEAAAAILPESVVEPVATAEPGADRSAWAVASDNARAVAGNLRLTLDPASGRLTLAFANGITVRAARAGDHRASEKAGAAQPSFAELLDAHPDSLVYVYDVEEERLTPGQVGGLCRPSATKHLAATEFVDESGAWVLRVAAFRGGASPGPGAQGDPDPCWTFPFVLGR